MFKADFRQTLAEKWLLNGSFQLCGSGLLELSSALLELMEDGGDEEGCEEDETEDEADVSPMTGLDVPNKPLHEHA